MIFIKNEDQKEYILVSENAEVLFFFNDVKRLLIHREAE